MKKVLMIQPPHFRFLGSQNRRVFPAFNSAALRLSECGWDVSILNMDIFKGVGETYANRKVMIKESVSYENLVNVPVYYLELLNILSSYNYDLVIISAGDLAVPTADLGTLRAAKQVASMVSCYSEARMICVGPRAEPYYLFDACFNTPLFEYFPDELIKGQKLGCEGIVSHPIDDMELYMYRVDPCNFDYILKSRGCIYSCDFCLTNYIFEENGVKEFNLPEPRFLESIKMRKEWYGITDFYFADTVFMVNTGSRLCNHLQDLRITWCCEGRVDLISNGFTPLKDMQVAGCNRIKIGVEGGSEEQLLSIGKDGVSPQMSLDAVSMISDAGMNPVVYVMLGGIGCDNDTYNRQLDFMDGFGDIEFIVNVSTPYKGTKFFNRVCDTYGIPKDTDRFDVPQSGLALREFWGISEDVMDRALNLTIPSCDKQEVKKESNRKYIDEPLADFFIKEIKND